VADRLPVARTDLAAATPADPAEPHLVLWNTAAFYALRPDQAERRRRIDHLDDAGRLVGSLVVGRADDGAWVSGFGAPFGGPDLVRPAETVANVEALLDHALAELDGEAGGPARVEVRARPAHYGPNDSAAAFTLLNRGFSVAEAEINAYLDLRPFAGAEGGGGAAYVASLKQSARKMLRRSEAQDLTVGQVPIDDAASWAEAYDVLRRNREDRGRPMRLPLDYVEAIRDAFPGRVRLLVVDQGASVVAAALVYRVLPGRDVVQYWGDAGHELALSPMNVLVRAVVEHGLASGTATIDVGISSEDGTPNHGLLQFKRSVGCEIEPRFVLARPVPGEAAGTAAGGAS
jgi:hypothetical protein